MVNLFFLILIISFLLCTITILPKRQQEVIPWAIAFVLLIWSNKKVDEQGFKRLIFIFLSLFIIIKYWYWRLSETVSYLSFFDFTACILLLLAELYSLLILLSGQFVTISPLRRKLKWTKEEITDKQDNLPFIDVYIPTYNEPLDIVKATIVGAKNLIYPEDRIRIYVLDDGATIQKRNSKNIYEKKQALKRYNDLKKFCEELDVSYLTREKNENAKAGNLNEALKKTSGDLIAVFDCDHVPTKDFLLHTVPYFSKNQRLFCVQTPHFFINPDPVEKNLRTFYAAPSENEMFYRQIQPGLDFWNSSFFCGSAALLSRKALEEIGGFLGKSVTEDAETSINLHARGYDTVYVDKPLICGLTPESFVSFVRQRIRWAQGMIQIYLFDNPLLKKGLRWYQRICYNNCIFFWFYGFARLVFIFAPLFFIFFSLHIYNASFKQILFITLPYIVTIYSLEHYLFGKVRWPLFSEIYETITSIYLIPSIIGTIINPYKPTFTVTPKKENLKKDEISPLSKPFYIIFIILLIGFIYALWRIKYDPLHRETLIITALWTLFNLQIIFWILGALYERHQLRKFHRTKAWGKVHIIKENQKIEGQMKDLSLSGIGFSIKNNQEVLIAKKDKVYIETQDSFGETFKLPIIIKRITKKDDKLEIGAEFAEIENTYVYKKLVSFVYGDSTRWVKILAEREKPVSVFTSVFFLGRYASLWALKSLGIFWKATQKNLFFYLLLISSKIRQFCLKLS